MMIAFDLIINNRGIAFGEILIILILMSGILISFLGDKFFGHEYDHHVHRHLHKNSRKKLSKFYNPNN